jgi:hypothetical protein
MGLECNEETRAGCWARTDLHIVGGRAAGCRCACHFDPTVKEGIHIQIKPWVARRLDDMTRKHGRAWVDAAIERLIINALDAAEHR